MDWPYIIWAPYHWTWLHRSEKKSNRLSDSFNFLAFRSWVLHCWKWAFLKLTLATCFMCGCHAGRGGNAVSCYRHLIWSCCPPRDLLRCNVVVTVTPRCYLSQVVSLHWFSWSLAKCCSVSLMTGWSGIDPDDWSSDLVMLSTQRLTAV